MAIVADMKHLRWGKGGEAWKWCGRLWAWEKEQPRESSKLLNSYFAG